MRSHSTPSAIGWVAALDASLPAPARTHAAPRPSHLPSPLAGCRRSLRWPRRATRGGARGRRAAPARRGSRARLGPRGRPPAWRSTLALAVLVARRASCWPCWRSSSAATRTRSASTRARRTGATAHATPFSDGRAGRHHVHRASRRRSPCSRRSSRSVETARTRSRWVVPFLLLVVAGNGILTTTIKHLADRVRPDAQPDRRDARAVVPERALVLVGRVLRGSGAAAGARPRAARARIVAGRRRGRRARWRSRRRASCSTCTG